MRYNKDVWPQVHTTKTSGHRCIQQRRLATRANHMCYCHLHNFNILSTQLVGYCKVKAVNFIHIRWCEYGLKYVIFKSSRQCKPCVHNSRSNHLYLP